MSIKTIYIIRHGETDYNKQGIVQGSAIDAELNETGHAQAKAFYEAYKHLKFDKIYTSALIRTHQSVQQFIKDGHAHKSLSGLNEISWGVKEGKIPNSNDDFYYNKLIQDWARGHTNLPVEGGESPEDVAKRQKEAFEIILKNKHEENILVAMHGRAMRILLAQLLGYELSDMDLFEHQNLCLYKLQYNYTHQNFELLLSNDVSHLKDLGI